MRKPSAAALFIALCSTAVVGACSDPTSNGPIVYPREASGGLCAQLADYPVSAFGVSFPEDLPAGMTITQVDLIAPQGLELISTHIAPLSSSGMHFLFGHYPPTDAFPQYASDAIPADGATIPTDQSADLILEIRVVGTDGGSATGVRIRYSWNGSRYFVDVPHRFTISSTDCP